MYGPRAGRINISPQRVPFDLALRAFFPKNKAMSRLSESKGRKLKTSNRRQQNNCIQKCASFHEPYDPVWSYQPRQRNSTHAPLPGKSRAHLEKHICWEEPLGKMAVQPAVTHGFSACQRDREQPGGKERCAESRATPAASGGEQEDLDSAMAGLCWCYHC